MQSNRCHRDDMADCHSALLEDHPVDDQPQNLLLDLKGWIDEGGANACAERLKSFQEPDCLLTFAALSAEFVKPLAQVSGVILDPATAFLQLIQLDRGGLVAYVNELRPTLLTNVGSPWLQWLLITDAARPSQPARPLGAVQKAARRPCRVANTLIMGQRLAWPCCV